MSDSYNIKIEDVEPYTSHLDIEDGKRIPHGTIQGWGFIDKTVDPPEKKPCSINEEAVQEYIVKKMDLGLLVPVQKGEKTYDILHKPL